MFLPSRVDAVIHVKVELFLVGEHCFTCLALQLYKAWTIKRYQPVYNLTLILLAGGGKPNLFGLLSVHSSCAVKNLSHLRLHYRDIHENHVKNYKNRLILFFSVKKLAVLEVSRVSENILKFDAQKIGFKPFLREIGCKVWRFFMGYGGLANCLRLVCPGIKHTFKSELNAKEI